uniref:Cyclin N-terminal domain-containing protein n=1 Tax=Setaria digitata TaxID=48799 RepID=A0A915PS36_9BILA
MSTTVTSASISTSQAAASGERQSAAAASASASVPSSSRWIFTHEQLMKVPSIREGMSPEEELKRRRVAASTIHQMADRLNHESRVRISQLCICAAMMHMHRFFVFHSFFKFDPRDIAAACLFLAGKSEECPRKLDHVVRIWWAIKFPNSPNLDSARLHDASQLIVTLENLVLQTIGKLHMTNWGVRYTAKAIACVCIQMACLWAEFEIQTTPDEAPWYKQVDPTMTLDKLLKLTEEFSRIYKTHGESLNIKKYAMRSSLRETAPQNPNQPQQQLPQQPSPQQYRQGQNQVAPSIATLPPPPVAPQLNAAAGAKGAEPTRRIDLSDYKLRNSAAQQQQQQSSSSQNSTAQTQRRNFMRPDVPPQTASKGLDLPLPPIIANEKQLSQSKPDQASVRPCETTKVIQISKSGTPKPATSQKSLITNTLKSLQPARQAVGASEHERHKRPKPEDYEKDFKQRRIEKISAEGSHHRKRLYENSVAVSQPDNTSATSAPVTNVALTPKSGTPKSAERHNLSALASHMTSDSHSTTSRLREETPAQPIKRDSNNSSSNRARDESIPSRQRDDTSAVKRPRQAAPLIALLPTPPAQNTVPPMSGNSQNSKYNLSATQPSRSNYVGEGTHRANATTNWSGANDYYLGSSSSNATRFSQSSGSSNHRHYSSSNAGRTKSREPLLSTPDTGNSSYYKRSRPRPSSPTVAATSTTYRQSQRPSSPGNRSGSGYSSNGFSRRCYCRRHACKMASRQSSSRYKRGEWRRRRSSWRSRIYYPSYADTSLANAPYILASSSTHMLSALPPPPLPPPNEELEDGEVL